MKYAIISDIHGNYPALKAVLADAKAFGVDKYLFLGDYYRDFPWVNEVVETIRGLKNAVAIRGNNEAYLIQRQIEDQAGWVYDNYKPSYWNFFALKPENLEYLISLPNDVIIPTKFGDIYLNHDLNVFFRKQRMPIFHTSAFRAWFEKSPRTHDDYLTAARDLALSRPDVVADISSLPKGIHLFGHNHLQFHMEYDGRLFVNPGACGCSANGNPSAVYTILGYSDNGWNVIERSVDYDRESTLAALKSSEFASYCPAWCKIVELNLLTGKDYLGPFIRHVREVGKQFGQETLPVNNDVWALAVETWDKDKIF